MHFAPAIAEQRFVLEHVAGINALATCERFAAASEAATA